jgi:hypothetical protein
VAAIAYGLIAPSPITLKITGIRTNGFLSGIDLLDLRVHNGTAKPLTPAYTVQTNHGDTTFWDVVGGPKTIRPGDTANVSLSAVNAQAQPSLNDGFSVLAFTDKPAAVSVSNRFLLNLDHAAFLPQTFNNAVPVGKRIRLQVEILNDVDAQVHRAGIPVYLNQARYTSGGQHMASAKINRNPPGTGGIEAVTNSSGIATFYIVGTQRTGIPISFSAHLRNLSSNYIYGSSGTINIRFKRNVAQIRQLHRQRAHKLRRHSHHRHH